MRPVHNTPAHELSNSSNNRNLINFDQCLSRGYPATAQYVPFKLWA